MTFLAVKDAIDEGICDFEQEYFFADICLIRIKQDLSNINASEIDRAYDELIEKTREMAFASEEDDYSLIGSDDDGDANA